MHLQVRIYLLTHSLTYLLTYLLTHSLTRLFHYVGEFQGNIIGALNKRGGLIMATDLNDDGSQVTIQADVPLAAMFGYSTDLRSSTQGKAEFSMEYKHHNPVSYSLLTLTYLLTYLLTNVGIT